MQRAGRVQPRECAGAVMCGVRVGDTGTGGGDRSEHQRRACENGVGGSTDGMWLVIRTGCGVV